MLESIWGLRIRSKRMTSADMLKSFRNQSNKASVLGEGNLPHLGSYCARRALAVVLSLVHTHSNIPCFVLAAMIIRVLNT